MKKIIAKKERLKEIQNNLKRSEEEFDSLVDWRSIFAFNNQIRKYKSQIVRMLFDPKTVNRKGKGSEINQSEVIMKNERHKLVDIKKYNGHNFEVYISYELSNGHIALTVRCLTVIPKENITLCLKVVNVANEGEIQGKYSLDPEEHQISCQTIEEKRQRSRDILNCLKDDVECSMDCLLYIYEAVDKKDIITFRGHDLKKVYYNLP
jgi:hypothetical protein